MGRGRSTAGARCCAGHRAVPVVELPVAEMPVAHSKSMRRTSPAGLALLAVLSLTSTFVALETSPAGAAVPAGFRDDLVASLAGPTALAFTPDGRMLVTTQAGTVRVVKNQVLMQVVALNISSRVCSNSERGLLGVAVDPNFATNGYVFLYYSFKKTGTCDATTVNRVSRWVMTGDTLAGETVLVDNIPSPAGNHNAGDVEFGKDGYLYVSVGDGGCDYAGGGCGGGNDASRDQHVLVGKILRITRDGGIPADNPFQGAGTARCNVTGTTTAGNKCQETFAWGLRNPFRMAFDPNAVDTRFHINDVGQGAWEEVDLGNAGADYGWNVREGHCANGSTSDCGAPPAGMTNPIFDYGRTDGCGSITGGAFVPNGLWPADYQGKYLFSDYNCGKIFHLDPSGGGFNRVDFATGLGSGSAVHLRFGPYGSTQALYYTTYAGGGQIRRIATTAAVPSVLVTGFTWYDIGIASQSGPGSTAVRAFGTQLKPATQYYLVTAPPESDPALTCSRNLQAVNGAVRRSSGSGFVGTTTGLIDRPVGNWNVCFRSLDGTTVGAPVQFTVV